MDQYQTLLYEVTDNVGLLTLNRPESLNAISFKMIEELDRFWIERRDDNDTRVVIISAAGDKGFCGGLDMKEGLSRFAQMKIFDMYRFQSGLSRVLLAMRQAPQPIIAAVFGAAVGAGMSLSLACDLRVITPDTRFSAAYINIGFGGADIGSSYFLPRLIGAGRAYEYMLTGDFMDAETAMNLGMVSRVVERDNLMDTALDLARTMCRKNPLGLRLTKEAINVNIDAAGLEHAIRLEDRNQAMCFTTVRYEGQSPITK